MSPSGGFGTTFTLAVTVSVGSSLLTLQLNTSLGPAPAWKETAGLSLPPVEAGARCLTRMWRFVLPLAPSVALTVPSLAGASEAEVIEVGLVSQDLTVLHPNCMPTSPTTAGKTIEQIMGRIVKVWDPMACPLWMRGKVSRANPVVAFQWILVGSSLLSTR